MNAVPSDGGGAGLCGPREGEKWRGAESILKAKLPEPADGSAVGRERRNEEQPREGLPIRDRRVCARVRACLRVCVHVCVRACMCVSGARQAAGRGQDREPHLDQA